jgi:hypothetical protein
MTCGDHEEVLLVKPKDEAVLFGACMTCAGVRLRLRKNMVKFGDILRVAELTG